MSLIKLSSSKCNFSQCRWFMYSIPCWCSRVVISYCKIVLHDRKYVLTYLGRSRYAVTSKVIASLNIYIILLATLAEWIDKFFVLFQSHTKSCEYWPMECSNISRELPIPTEEVYLLIHVYVPPCTRPSVRPSVHACVQPYVHTSIRASCMHAYIYSILGGYTFNDTPAFDPTMQLL